MFELLIDKAIGEDAWGKPTGVPDVVSARYVREQLAAFSDDEKEMRVVIDSPGGDVFEGITIFNIIRDFARSHADVRITTYIQGMAASMASVIALAANSVNPENKVIAEDNSVFMIHNAWDIVWGNRNDLRDAADFLEQIDGVLRGAYVKRTGKGENDIAALMDAETWLWGAEIKDAGFADSIIEYQLSEEEKRDEAKGLIQRGSRDFSIRVAKGAVGAARKTMQTVAAKASKTEGRNWGAAAMALGFTTHGSSKGGEPSNIGPGAAASDGNHKRRGCMTAEEFRKDNPEAYAQIVAEAEKAGIAKEQARANRLLKMGDNSGAKDYALECIKNGADPMDATVIDTFMDRGKAEQILALQREDEEEIPDLHNLPKNTLDDSEEIAGGFNKATGGR